MLVKGRALMRPLSTSHCSNAGIEQASLGYIQLVARSEAPEGSLTEADPNLSYSYVTTDGWTDEIHERHASVPYYHSIARAFLARHCQIFHTHVRAMDIYIYIYNVATCAVLVLLLISLTRSERHRVPGGGRGHQASPAPAPIHLRTRSKICSSSKALQKLSDSEFGLLALDWQAASELESLGVVALAPLACSYVAGAAGRTSTRTCSRAHGSLGRMHCILQIHATSDVGGRVGLVNSGLHM